MKRRTAIFGGLTAMAGCARPGQRWELRYRMTLALSAGGARHVGSSVFRSVYARGNFLSQAQGYDIIAQSWGEAITIKIDGVGIVAGYLSAPPGTSLSAGFFSVAGGSNIISQLQRLKLLDKDERDPAVLFPKAQVILGQHEYPLESRPWLLLFPDPNSAASVKVLNDGRETETQIPNLPLFDIEDVLGKGAGIESFTIEFVQAEPTDTILAVLPWLQSLDKFRCGPSFGRPFHETLCYGEFKLEGHRS